MNGKRSGSIKSDFGQCLFFIINIIIYPCHLFALQTKDKEGQFDSTKFSDAYLCRKFGVPRTTVIFNYGARQFLHRNLYSVTYNVAEESIDLVPLLILHIESLSTGYSTGHSGGYA